MAIAAPGLSHADCDPVSMGTSSFAFPHPVTEAKCLDNAKRALAAQFKDSVSKVGDHAYVAGTNQVKVTVECLHSVGANAAHVSFAFHASAIDATKVSTLVSTIIHQLVQ